MSEEEGGRLLPFPGGPASPDAERLVPALEALLFAAGGPVTLRALADALQQEDAADVQHALDRLRVRLGASDRGLELVEVAGGWQLRTHPRWGEAVMRLLGGTPQRLSRAALEVLAVVAYRQPITRVEVEALRGVGSGGVLKTLLERGLIRVAGRRDEPGRPLQYATSSQFLELYGLADLSGLPSLRDREELTED